MEEMVQKLNRVKNHNQIVKLKKENKLQKEKIKQINSDYRNMTQDIIDKYKKICDEKITEKNNKISELEKQVTFYQNALNKIPNFILKIFLGKKMLLDKGE